MKKRRLSLVLLFGILLGVISLGITLYPLIGNYLSEKNKSTVLTEYARTVEKLEDTSIREMLADAQAYNNALMPGTLSMENIFSQAGHAVAEDTTSWRSTQTASWAMLRSRRSPCTYLYTTAQTVTC